jgi:hypothetical protein
MAVSTSIQVSGGGGACARKLAYGGGSAIRPALFSVVDLETEEDGAVEGGDVSGDSVALIRPEDEEPLADEFVLEEDEEKD